MLQLLIQESPPVPAWPQETCRLQRSITRSPVGGGRGVPLPPMPGPGTRGWVPSRKEMEPETGLPSSPSPPPPRKDMWPDLEPEIRVTPPPSYYVRRRLLLWFCIEVFYFLLQELLEKYLQGVLRCRQFRNHEETVNTPAKCVDSTHCLTLILSKYFNNFSVSCSLNS